MDMQIDTRTINLNTVISAVGFLATFVMLGAAWGSTQATLADVDQWRQTHDTLHRDLQADLSARTAAIDEQIGALRSNLVKIDQLEYRMATSEKGAEAIDARVTRIAESYSNQFADIRTQLSTISTQIALTNQTLQRIEAATPSPSR